MTWAENEWVGASERRQSTIATAVVVSLFVAGGALHAAGLFMVAVGDDGLLAISGDLLALLATSIAAMWEENRPLKPRLEGGSTSGRWGAHPPTNGQEKSPPA